MGVTRFNPKEFFSSFSFRRPKARASSSTPTPALSANTSQDTIQHGDTTSNGQHAFLNITARDARRSVSAPGIRDPLQVPHEAAPRTGAPASVRSVAIGTSQAPTRSSSPNPWPTSISPNAKDTLTIDAGRITATKRINLWQDAQAKLPKERRERLLKGGSSDINLVESLINEVKEKKQSIDETKRWYHEYMGSTLEQLQKYAIIGDIAIQHNPDIVALAWAGFRFLLNVVSAHTENMKSIGESFSKLLRIICCCDIYERLYINVSLTISGQLVDSIVDLYVAVFEYLFYAEEHLRKGTAAQICNSFLDGSRSMFIHMEDLERDVTNKAGVAEKEAADAGRTLQIENAETLKRLLGELQAPLTKIQSSVERMFAIVQGGRRSEILMWLSKMPFDDHHVYFSKRRREGTGGWLLQHEKYRAWKISDKSSTFWLRGGAGCGKSYLASRIVDHFREEARNLSGSGYAVAYFYCHYSEEGRNNPESILRTIVKQLCFAMGEDSETLPRATLAIYEKREKHGHSSGPLSVEESRDLIIDLCRGFTKVTLIIDALDECNKETRRHLFRALNRIASESNLVKVFVTGRNSEDIQNTLLDHSSHHIDATDNTRDIDHYIETEIERRSNPMELEGEEVPLLEGDFVSKELKDHIKSTLKEKANGMFMWAQFQIIAICNECTETDVRNALGFLPKDLDATYGRIIDGIESQTSSRASVAKKVLKWISFAQEPSSIDTIIQSLAVEPNQTLPDKGQLEWTLQRVLGACQSLVIFDETLGTLRFAHFSVQEYLNRQPEFAQERGHAYMADICLTLLTYDPEYIEGLQLPGLGVYAVKHWGTHARLSGPLSVGGCMKFLKHPTAYRKWGLQVKDEGPDLQESDSGNLVTPFWVACYYGLPHALERLNPSQVNTGNHRGTTPLLIAAKRKHVNIIRMLLAMDGVDVNATDEVGRVPLSVAAYEGHKGIVAMLLAVDGVDVNGGGKLGTALSGAAYNGHKEIVAMLLAVDGVDVNLAGQEGTALLRAARRGDKEIVAMLLAVDGVDVNGEGTLGTPLLEAVFAGHKDIVAMLLGVDGVDVNGAEERDTELFMAAYMGHKEIVAMMLAVDGVDVNWTGEEGTALCQAARRGDKKIVAMLLAVDGVDVNGGGKYGTALSWAARRGEKEIVAMLLAVDGVDVNRGVRKGTALSRAAYHGHKEIVAMLLAVDGVDVNGGGVKGTALSGAAYKGHPEIVAMLLAVDGVDVNRGEKLGTPLLQAVLAGHEEIVTMLLAVDGVDVNGGGEGGTPLLQAVLADHKEIVAMLLAVDGVDVNRGGEGGTALSGAAYNGHKEIVAMLLAVDGVDVNGGGEGGTALSGAAYNGHKEIVAMLLAVDGVDVNGGGKLGTALSWAALRGHAEIVAMLLAVDGVDVNAPDKYSNSPLHSAVKGGDKEIVTMLLAVDGVDVNVRNYKGSTPLAWAIRYNREEMAHLLRAVGDA